jgi:hypothetical protein
METRSRSIVKSDELSTAYLDATSRIPPIGGLQWAAAPIGAAILWLDDELRVADGSVTGQAPRLRE